MAPKTHKIHVKIPAQLGLTSAEIAKLKKVYKAGTAQVLKARKTNEPAPETEQNIGSGRPARKAKKAPATKKKK